MGSSYETVLVPGRGDYYAPELAQELSRALKTSAVSWEVYDSDVITATVFAEGGETMHKYVSAQPTGDGPAGVDPEPFRPFGSDQMDAEKLEWALRGGPHTRGLPWLFAEEQHRLVIETLGLTPESHILSLSFDQACDADYLSIPGVRRVCELPPEADYWSVPDED